MASPRDRTPATTAPRSGTRRGEHALAHSVYGLILMLATAGELIAHEESARTSVAWLLGAGAVLFAAHLFSDVLAHLASTREDPSWSSTLRISRSDVSVTFGFIAAAAVVATAGLTGLDTRTALWACVAVGLIAVAMLSFNAAAHHRMLTRVALGSVAVGLCVVIVVGENVF